MVLIVLWLSSWERSSSSPFGTLDEAVCILHTTNKTRKCMHPALGK